MVRPEMDPAIKTEAPASFRWGGTDPSQVPFAVYWDESLFAAEQERIFQGPLWHYLGLEVEIPAAGDFVTRYVGTTPVVLNRTADGRAAAFVNRCAHRGALVQRERRGNCAAHVCIYHQWTYNLDGDLTGVPYRRGLNNSGGFPADFKLENHGMRKLRTATHQGVIFGSLHESPPDLKEFLSANVADRIARIFNRPLKVIGYQRQKVRANWKLMVENVKDSYHGALLHAFNSKFGFFRSTQKGDVTMSGSGVHSMLTTYATLNEQAGQAFDNVTTYKPQLTLEDATMLRRIPEFDDNIITSIISIFPSMLMLSGGNFMCYRNLRPKSVNEFEMVWTYVGYADDSADMSDLRLRQMNLFGPGGYVSIEDAEALEIVQRAIEGEHRDDYSGVVALGGRDVRDQPHLVTEVAIRAFWHGYRDLMGLKLAS